MASILERVRSAPAEGDDRLKALIRARARAQGFDVAGFAAADLPRPIQRAWHEFVVAGRQGEMDWLARDPVFRDAVTREGSQIGRAHV